MSQSKSKLLNYISLLLSDDEALQRFLIDPITDAEGKYGITKAERAVLRRTVFHLSNRSLNGYTLVRHLGSYRRSLRLLQNVLHNVGSKMAQEVLVAASAQAQAQAQAEDTENGPFTFTVIYYWPDLIGGSEAYDFTGMTNEQAYNGNNNLPYVHHAKYLVRMPIDNPTIKDVMDQAQLQGTPTHPVARYETDSSGQFMTSLTLPDNTVLIADPTDPRYDLADNPNANFIFWFWSINGTPNKIPGIGGSSAFTTPTLNDGDTVCWQLIAPDFSYGFSPCTTTPGNTFAEAEKASKAAKT